MTAKKCDNAAMPQGHFCFGLFQFDTESLALLRDGTLVHLQQQPKSLLLYLVRNADRTVSREELRTAIWGDQTFVDFERGLNFCVSQIRSALSDDAANPTYIRTVARQGYRFIAPVKFVPVVASDPTVAADHRSRLHMLVAAAVLLLAFLVAGGLIVRVRSSKRAIVAVMRFDNETGDPSMTRFSDGLTDTFVERLTSLSNGRYAVIGNANALRGPRDQRDLSEIARSLQADYIILGQVQAYGGQTRVLAHLIHMPEQTHVWVTRIDRALTNPLDLESEAAQRIAADFASPLTSGDVSPFRASH
jgi:TolB-like protein/DNA-binding winged helix-turn-helix (wHTH) protein